jgi:hypothetical protein
MSVWEAITWDVARAGGFTAYILVTLAIALGLILTLHWQSPRWPRLINSELHNFVTLLSLVFVGVHVLAVWVDPFTRFGWNEIFIPFASHYRPLWMALGIIALYLGIAIGITTWLRPHIGYRWWRRCHVLTLLIFALATVHGIATGSDTRTWWGMAIYTGSALLVGTLLWQRLHVPVSAQGRAHPILATGMLLLVLAGTIWTVLGPLQPGWNAIANNGQGSGARTAAPVSPQQSSTSSAAPAFTTPFRAVIQGTLTQTGPDAHGTVILRIDTTLSQGAQGTLQIVLQGQISGDDEDGMNITASQVTLNAPAGGLRYVGPLTRLAGEQQWYMAALLTATGSSGSQVEVQVAIHIAASGQVSGMVAGIPATVGNSA